MRKRAEAYKTPYQKAQEKKRHDFWHPPKPPIIKSIISSNEIKDAYRLFSYSDDELLVLCLHQIVLFNPNNLSEPKVLLTDEDKNSNLHSMCKIAGNKIVFNKTFIGLIKNILFIFDIQSKQIETEIEVKLNVEKDYYPYPGNLLSSKDMQRFILYGKTAANAFNIYSSHSPYDLITTVAYSICNLIELEHFDYNLFGVNEEGMIYLFNKTDYNEISQLQVKKLGITNTNIRSPGMIMLKETPNGNVLIGENNIWIYDTHNNTCTVLIKGEGFKERVGYLSGSQTWKEYTDFIILPNKKLALIFHDTYRGMCHYEDVEDTISFNDLIYIYQLEEPNEDINKPEISINVKSQKKFRIQENSCQIGNLIEVGQNKYYGLVKDGRIIEVKLI
ncbi:MAG: hypothetical protein MJ252_13965 [archaeon]|nr:hypothetical protein [archaeon]